MPADLPLSPFATSDAPARSLNRARIVDLPGVAVDDGILGRSAYDLLSAGAVAALVRAAAGELGLDPDAPDLLRRFDGCFDDPDARPTALSIARTFGRRLGYLLLTLHRGDEANRAARPEWSAAHWAYWRAVERVVVGGGLVAGRMGAAAAPAAQAVLDAHADGTPRVERSPFGAAIALVGLARSAPPAAHQMLVFDFGQTSVKRGVAEYEDGALVDVQAWPACASPCGVAAVGERWRRMLDTVLAAWADLPPAAPSATAVGLCVASHLRDGHPFPTEAGCYGALQSLAPHLASFMQAEIERRTGPLAGFALLHDGTAAAAPLAGVPRAAVLTLGTALGVGYPGPAVGMRPLADGLVLRRA